MGANLSYVWRSLMQAQEVMKQGCRRRIGNGKSTRIWQVPWLKCPLNGYITTVMPEELKETRVENLFAENRKEWDGDVLKDKFNDRDCEQIRNIQIPLGHREDKWSCRRVFPTADALRRKSVNVSSVWSWCLTNVEDDLHVLFECSFAKEVWTNVGLLNIVQVRPNDFVLCVLKRAFQLGDRDQIGLLGMVCWNLWNRQNNWVWNRINCSSFSIQSRAFSMIAEWNRAREASAKLVNQNQATSRVWTKPPEGWIKINIDVVCHLDTGQAGVGCIIRDYQGYFFRVRSKVLQRNLQPREAEAMGLREALTWTKEWRNNKGIFESDAKGMVEAINGGSGSSYFHMIIEDCREIHKYFSEVLVVFTYRSANTLAHLLAKATYFMSGNQEWLLTAPEFISCIVDVEKV
ncbi:uncharacterized protein LOC141659986 [Apium graveolens]|uniref:uncharacterized protein LOC141659986 n=1 Tax=Apium graveolens TaxID=4045 RepID=UPI003D79598F